MNYLLRSPLVNNRGFFLPGMMTSRVDPGFLVTGRRLKDTVAVV
jgi:hypothetical protein